MTEEERAVMKELVDLLSGDEPFVATEVVKLLEKAQELIDEHLTPHTQVERKLE